MKIQINTEEKTVVLIDDVKLTDLIAFLGDDYPQWTIKRTTEVLWSNPSIIYKDRRPYTWPWQDPYYITCGTITTSLYNVDVRDESPK